MGTLHHNLLFFKGHEYVSKHQGAPERGDRTVKNGTTERGSARLSGQRTALAVVPAGAEPNSAARAEPSAELTAKVSIGAMESGIVVREQELGTVQAQRLYKLRCECGRSWFELELPTLVECPACKKPSLVSA